MTSIDFMVSFIKMTNETNGHYEVCGELTNRVLDSVQNILIHFAALLRYFCPLVEMKCPETTTPKKVSEI